LLDSGTIDMESLLGGFLAPEEDANLALEEADLGALFEDPTMLELFDELFPGYDLPPMDPEYEKNIRDLVSYKVLTFLRDFETRHLMNLDNPDGPLNAKYKNPFLADLGPEMTFQSSVWPSFESGLGSMQQELARQLAWANFEVYGSVDAYICSDQVDFINYMCERYQKGKDLPTAEEYETLRNPEGTPQRLKVTSDLILKHRGTGEYTVIELKSSGNLDTKKAYAEKRSLLTQYCVLSNALSDEEPPISMKFATTYNSFGEHHEWKHTRVKKYFRDEDLLIGKDFWNFVIQHPAGHHVFLSEYRKHKETTKGMMQRLKSAYAG